MSRFSYRLASGMSGLKLSRADFYGNILKVFIESGLIALQPELDPVRRMVVRVYRAVIQPIPLRRPPAPSIIYNAHIIAERWNEEFA